MKYRIIIVLLTVIVSLVCNAQKFPTKNFEGSIYPGDFEILLLFKAEESRDSTIVKLYVPEQNVFGEMSTNVRFDNDSVFIYFDKIKMRIEGIIERRNMKFSGFYIQGRNKFDLVLSFVADKKAVSFDRPQTPKEPVHYVVEEHLIENAIEEITLSGSLFLPDTIQKHKLAIILTGGGAPGRNEIFGGHQIYFVLADFLVRNGIAVFYYDERGAGKSSGRFADNTTATYRNDAGLLFDYLQNHKNINSERIGLIGHSEGALVAFKLASIRPEEISFVISMAGPGVAIPELLKQQAADFYKISDMSDEHKINLTEYRRQLFDMAARYNTSADLRNAINPLTEEYAKKFTEEEAEKYRLTEVGAHQFITQVTSKWLSYFIRLDPYQYIRRVKCPVLAINGDKDIQINAFKNIPAIERGLIAGDNFNYKIYIYEGLNHLFQTANTGSPDEYMYINETISPIVLKDILRFIKSI